MTTQATQNCPACGALTNYEGHEDLRRPLVRHRFHCHRCGRLYIVQSTTHKMPRFALKPRHEMQTVGPETDEHLAEGATSAAGAEAEEPENEHDHEGHEHEEHEGR